jgi:hypothetical protein
MQLETLLVTCPRTGTVISLLTTATTNHQHASIFFSYKITSNRNPVHSHAVALVCVFDLHGLLRRAAAESSASELWLFVGLRSLTSPCPQCNLLSLILLA